VGGLGSHISQRDREYFEDHGEWYPGPEPTQSKPSTKGKVRKTITLKIEYVENQSTFIPDESREQSCAGEVVKVIGNMIEKGEVSKGEGEVWIGHKTKYNLSISKK